MTSSVDSSVIIQTSAESVPSTPSWFGARRADRRVSSQILCSPQNQ